MEAASTCFGLQRNYPQGATASTYLELKAWFSVDIDVVQRLSVLWRHSMICVACVLCTTHTTYYAAITLTTSVRRLYLH
jgi:hypothetical protein